MPAILFSSKAQASPTIASQLIPLGFDKKNETEWEFGRTRLIDAKVESMLDAPTSFETDYFIVLSKHRSEANLKSLTVHIPGNWDSADFGGDRRILNISYPGMQRILLRKMAEKNKKYGLGFNVAYEVDHHGPTIQKPIIFVEIGSTEAEWSNPVAGKIIAESVFESINEEKENRGQCENFFAAGGGHYAPKFTELALKKDFAFGHMLPKYRADSIAIDTFVQALEKNLEPVEKILIDRKGLNKEQRDKLLSLAREFGKDVLEA